MIDIHSHILPEVDDGSDSMEVSLLMAGLAADTGVTRMVASLHSNQRGSFENYTSDELFERIRTLRREIKTAGIELDVVPGMEVFASDDVPQLLIDGKLLPINGSRYMLIEFSFDEDPGYIDSLLHRLMDIKCRPVLAHPERYKSLQIMPSYLYDWACEGVALQINKGSLFGHFGKKAQALSLAMLDRDLVALVASDAHGYERRNTDMTDALDFLTADFSASRAARLLTENPERILKNEPLVMGDMQPFEWFE